MPFPTRVQPLARHLERATLIVGVAPYHVEPLLRPPQLEVRPGQLGGQRYLNVAHVLGFRFYRGALSLKVVTQAAEEVELPRRIEARVPDALIGKRAAADREGGAGEPLPGEAASRGYDRRQIEPRLRSRGPSTPDPRGRGADVEIGAHQLADETVEGGVSQLAPVLRVRLCRRRGRLRHGRRVDAGFRRGRRRGVESLPKLRRHRHPGGLVARAGAGGQPQRHQNHRCLTHGTPPRPRPPPDASRRRAAPPDSG